MLVRGIYPEVPGLPPLRWMMELGRLSEITGVELKLTIGPDIREPNVAQALRDPSDLIIMSGHGEENGFILPSRKILRGRWIGTQARGREKAPRAIILASCGSGCADTNNESLTWQIAKMGINAIGMPPNVPDEAALTYVVEFVRALIAGADVGESHDVAVEAIADDWPDAARQMVLLPGLTNGYRFIVETLNSQGARLAKLEQGQDQILDLLKQSLEAKR
jgi:hypothetical protein